MKTTNIMKIITKVCGIAAALCLSLTSTAQTVVYENAIETASDFEDLTVVDYNGEDHSGDGNTWSFNEWQSYAQYQYSSISPADDWLITASIQMKANVEYTFTFEVSASSNAYPEAYSVMFGQGTNLESYQTIKAKTSVSFLDFQEQTVTTSVSEAGNYRFAIRCLSDADMAYFRVKNLKVTEGASFTSPAAVTNLVVTPAAQGQLKADISFNAPTEATDGSALTDLQKIEIYRDDALIKTFDNPAIGAAMSYTDENPINGWNNYSVKAFNEDGQGPAAEARVFVGNDTPAEPTDFVIKDNLDGTAAFSWTAPAATGVNGGYVNVAGLKYNVYIEDDETNPTIVKGNLTDTNCTITLPTSTSQDIRFYRVTAVAEQNLESEYALGSIIIGIPYTLPYEEGFANAQPEHFCISQKTGANGFQPITWMDADGNNGSIFASGLNSSDEATLCLGKISLKNQTSPTLKFKYYMIPGRNADLKVELVNPNQETTVIKTISLKNDEGTADWQSMMIELTGAPVEADYVVLNFHATANEDKCTFGIDAISITNVVDDDLSISLKAPAQVKAGEQFTVNATVKNIGRQRAEGYSVDFFVGEEKVASVEGEAISADNQTVVSYRHTTKVTDPETLQVYAVVNYDADKNADNNTSETVSVAVVQPSLPTVTDLSAELSNDAVSLTWTPIVTESETVTDGFEDYDDFTISAMGNWTLYDGDGEKTWKPSMYPDFANAGEPMAYIVFNPSALGIDLSDDDNAEYVPYNGNKFLASMASDSWMTGNNDFIISERLSGNKQTVKLFAKSFDATGYYKETFEIRYSTTGNNPDDFTNTVKTQECGSAWTEYSAELPAGAKYFAIVCTSKNMMMLQIDDVTYEKGGLTASSYNIYRDKELIGTSTTASYLDSDATAGEHVYNVTAVYDEGESSLSNDAVITISGIAEKLNGNAAVVGHYAADGRRIAASEKGMHIVKYNDGTTRKVMVK